MAGTPYFVDPTKSDSNDGLSWANAKATIQAALTAAGNAGADNLVIVKSTADHVLGADTTFTTTNSVSIIAATADDTSTAYTPTAMGTSNFVGRNDTTNYSIIWACGADDKVYMYGLTFRVVGSGTDAIRVPGTTLTGVDMTLENCYLWQGSSSTASYIRLGATEGALRMINCTLRFGQADQSAYCLGDVRLESCSVSTDGTAPTALFDASEGSAYVKCSGCDFRHITGYITGNSTYTMDVVLERCRIGTATVQIAQTGNPTLASARTLVLDCHSGDTHMEFGYYSGLGEVTKSTAVYVTAGAAAASWKIVTNANPTFWSPFITPWIDLYNTTTGSTIVPYFECLRYDGTATKFNDNDVWAEFSAKTSTGYTNAAMFSDRKDIDGDTAAAAQADGMGDGSWTTTGSTNPTDFKCDSGSTTLTPAEVGYIRGRICVGLPSITVYVDPQIRT